MKNKRDNGGDRKSEFIQGQFPILKENMSKGGGDKKSGKSHGTTPITSSVTKEEIAKIAQVSPTTVARYDVVMKSDEEDLKEQMKKSDITIRKASKVTFTPCLN